MGEIGARSDTSGVLPGLAEATYRRWRVHRSQTL